jgi:prepilin-type N-terminal cleavage/methylation domain-containing protein
MLNKLKKSNSEGFTIIEVMIVLAIAGLILLIVFLAIPALQRNSRNTAIKNDAAAVTAGINESESNNDGRSPTNVAGTGTVVITNTANTQATVQGNTVVSFVAAAGAAPAATAPAIGTITVYGGHKCTLAGVYTPGTAGDVSTRSFAIYYSVENATGTQQRCLES